MFPLALLPLVMWVAGTEASCPTFFSRFTETHSACLSPSPSCQVTASGVTPQEIETILYQHNILRSNLATGTVVPYSPAANMLQMVYDDELASVAQSYAYQCRFEHDCPNCRRVQNFAVGQNLAIQSITNSNGNSESPDWKSAIASWYDEIDLFNPNLINPFVAPTTHPTYGHFTQLAWATSWRIGCGYVKYMEKDTLNKLYVCNYGSAGNNAAGSLYKEGPPCSACPENSCCDATCGAALEFPGLCKITDGSSPTYKPDHSYRFYCDFQSQPDCMFSVSGENSWLIYNTLSGNYLSIVLNGGQKSSLDFQNHFQASDASESTCFVTEYRTGPNVAGEEEGHSVVETFSLPGRNYQLTQSLPDFNGDAKQEFSDYSMSLGWNLETQFQISFSVPPGKPQQFLEIQKLYVTDGPCP